MTHASRAATAIVLAALTIALAPLSCDRPQGHSDDKIVGAEAGDPRLAAATAEAIRRWNEFVTEFRTSDINATYLIKAPFAAKDGSVEHMWASVSAIGADSVTGTLESDPFGDFGVKKGDQVTVKSAEVEDWFVRKADGSELGNFSAPVLEQIEKEQAGK